MRKTASVIVAAALCGCAKSPESISPAYTSDITYRPLSCQELAIETARISQGLAAASAQQEKARTNDTVGVIFLGLPVSTLSGDNVAPEIARLKGEIEAIHRVSMEKHCDTAQSK